METKLTIENLSGDSIAVITETGEKFNLPKKFFPAQIKNGETFILTVKTEAQSKQDKELTAKDILNELLDVKDDNGQQK